MKNRLKFFILIFSFFLILSSCKEEEHYESRDVEIETVFDTIGSKEKDDDEKREVDEDNFEDKENTNQNNDNEFLDEYQIIDGGVNLRSSPEFGDNVVIQSEPGMEVRIIDQNIGDSSEWARIEYEELIYYVNMEIFE